VRNRVIIVADDDRAIRELMAVALSTELSAQVLLAPNRRRLLELAQHVRPAVVVTDVRMPELDGLEAVRRLRADPTTALVPVIAVSALTSRREALDAGCWGFVAKPFDLDELVDLVGNLMEVRGDAPPRDVPVRPAAEPGR
jgi:CheY-like chemotaxis protein